MRDISFEGIFIETEQKFAVGEKLKVEIPIGNSAKIIRTTGVVSRVTTDGVGVKLTKNEKFE